jgi:hypothetical protein
MASRHPTRAALAAAVVPAVAVGAFGNQWFTEHVRFEAKTALKRRMTNTVGGPFQWRFTPYRGSHGGTLWAAQILGIVAVIGLTFLVAWLAARSTASGGLLLAVWGGTVLATMAAYWLLLLTSYDAIYGGRDIEPGLNGFWYSVFHSPDSALWGAGVGLVAAGAAVLFAGGAARPAPGGPAPGWGQSTPTWGAAPPPSGATQAHPPQPPTDAPATPWTATPPRDVAPPGPPTT